MPVEIEFVEEEQHEEEHRALSNAGENRLSNMIDELHIGSLLSDSGKQAEKTRISREVRKCYSSWGGANYLGTNVLVSEAFVIGLWKKLYSARGSTSSESMKHIRTNFIKVTADWVENSIAKTIAKQNTDAQNGAPIAAADKVRQVGHLSHYEWVQNAWNVSTGRQAEWDSRRRSQSQSSDNSVLHLASTQPPPPPPPPIQIFTSQGPAVQSTMDCFGTLSTSLPHSNGRLHPASEGSAVGRLSFPRYPPPTARPPAHASQTDMDRVLTANLHTAAHDYATLKDAQSTAKKSSRQGRKGPQEEHIQDEGMEFLVGGDVEDDELGGPLQIHRFEATGAIGASKIKPKGKKSGRD